MAHRIIPINEWAPAHEAILSSPFEQETCTATRRHRLRSFSGMPVDGETRPRAISLVNAFRSRSKSVTPAPTFDSAVDQEQAHDHNCERCRPQESPKHDGARVRALLRRASVSIKGFVHRRTATVSEKPTHGESTQLQQRPTTSHLGWNRLRSATSFRHTRTSHGPESSQAMFFGDWPMNTVVPGVGAEPPIIPENSGAAAKASVPLSNEYLALSARSQNVSLSSALNKWLVATGGSDDGESGIGIALAAGSDLGLDVVNDTALQPGQGQGAGISRIDFIAELPLELAIQVLSHLDANAIKTAGRVSKTWRTVATNQHVWRESFLREKTTTFATSGSVKPGVGLGVPRIAPTNNWTQIYKAKEELDRCWEKGKMTPVYLNGHKDSIYCLQFDDHKIITGSRDRTIRIWDMHTYECKLVIGPPEVLDDVKILVDSNNQPVHYALLGDNRKTAESAPALVSFPTHHNASILCLQYDDQILVTGSSDSTCIVHNVRSGYRPIRRLRHHNAAVLDLAFDGKHIVTCSKDVTICVWDRETGQMLRQLRGHTGPVNSVQMRGNSIVSCSGDTRVKLWNVDTGKNIREFIGHTKGLACSQFSEDGRYVTSAGNEKVILVWDANTGECVREMRAHEGLVRSLHIDSVSGRLVSGSYDTDIKVFDLKTGTQLLEFPKWHQSWVLSAKSDYRRIVSTGQDPKILIMDFGASVKGIEALETTPAEGEESVLGTRAYA